MCLLLAIFSGFLQPRPSATDNKFKKLLASFFSLKFTFSPLNFAKLHFSPNWTQNSFELNADPSNPAMFASSIVDQSQQCQVFYLAFKLHSACLKSLECAFVVQTPLNSFSAKITKTYPSNIT